jgi:quercetin 2,3-dioxygenase
MKSILHKASERGHNQFSWLNSYHSFSFGHYFDENKVHFGALRVLNDDTVAPSGGFGTHPHDNMEIVSIPLSGALEHKDSIGTVGVIQSGDVQIMSAGTGIMHSEYNHSSTEEVKFLQIWIFPRERQIQPRYDQKTFDPNGRKGNWQILVDPQGVLFKKLGFP